MIKHIFVPYDGSDPSNRAFEFATELAKLYKASVTVVTCIVIHAHVDPVLSVAFLETIKLQKEDAEKSLSKLEPKLKELGIQFKTEVLEAVSITDVLTSYAESHNVDFITIGSRGLGGFKKLLLGSVASGISQHSKCPVLIVK
jgi:nucleotide-binding universal stress UspA family protein